MDYYESFECFPINKFTRIISCTSITTSDMMAFNGELCREYSSLNLRDDQVTDVIFSLCLFEPRLLEDYTAWLQESISNCERIFLNLKNVYILYDTAPYNKNIESKCNIQHVFVPFFLLRSSFTKNTNVRAWSPSYKKALYLIGDVRNRYHKFPLLYDFYKNDLLNLLEYSLDEKIYNRDNNYFSDDNFRSLMYILNTYYDTDIDINKLMGLYFSLKRFFPRDKFSIFNSNRVHMNYCAYTFPDEYNITSLEIVAETHFHNILQNRPHPYHFAFTEKIWKPIFLERPFITISHNDLAYKSLELLGFKTFVEYTDIPLINDNDNNIRKYTETTIRRTTNFFKNMVRYEKQIAADIAHNKKRWNVLCNNEWDNLYKNCPALATITKQEFGNCLIIPADLNQFHKYCI